MTDVYDAIVIGGRSVGVTLSSVINLRPELVTGSGFDESSHTWTVATVDGDRHTGRIVIAYGQAPAPTDGTVPYLGVAMHGRPNYFFISGPDISGQRYYIAECLNVMARRRSTRIEVRRSTQHTYTARLKPGATIDWRRMRSKVRSSFDLSSHTVADDVYDGRATVRIGDDGHDVRVRLTGHIDPIDGRYHWQGTILDALPAHTASGPVAMTIGSRSASARITEKTAQGGYSVVGVGTPPFTLDDIEVAVPLR